MAAVRTKISKKLKGHVRLIRSEGFFDRYKMCSECLVRAICLHKFSSDLMIVRNACEEFLEEHKKHTPDGVTVKPRGPLKRRRR